MLDVFGILISQEMWLLGRFILAAFTSFGISFLAYPYFIKYMRVHQFSQVIRKEGPQRHLLEKQCTPTMGGVVIIFCVVVSVLLWADLSNLFVRLSILTLLFFGLIGFLDDYLKVFLKSPYGLRAWQKYTLQSVGAVLVCWYAFEYSVLIEHSYTWLPFLGVQFGVFWFWMVLGYFTIVGSSNAVNLTDGLDGLAIVPVMFVALALSVMAFVIGQEEVLFASHIPRIHGADELAILGACVLGSGGGFLCFNHHPAKIFMGDVGSLSLGALLGSMAVLLRQEAVYFLMMCLFVWEVLSVVLQVVSFKARKKRIFLMAPFHHHLELKGWSESKVVAWFWLLACLLACAAVLMFWYA